MWYKYYCCVLVFLFHCWTKNGIFYHFSFLDRVHIVKQPDYTPTEQVHLCGNARKIHISSNIIPPETLHFISPACKFWLFSLLTEFHWSYSLLRYMFWWMIKRQISGCCMFYLTYVSQNRPILDGLILFQNFYFVIFFCMHHCCLLTFHIPIFFSFSFSIGNATWLQGNLCILLWCIFQYLLRNHVLCNQ